jgi:hypothetical protein
MNDLEKLLAIEEIKQLKARYFRSIDTKSFEELRTVFTPDGVFDFGAALRDPINGNPEGVPEAPPIVGLENIIGAIGAALATGQSAHHGHTPEIEILSETTAKALWPMEDVVINDSVNFRGYGHYDETYEKLDEGWRIKTSLLTRLRVIIES